MFKLNSIEIWNKNFYIKVKCFLNQAFLRNRSHIAVSTSTLYLCMCSVPQKLHYFQPRGFHSGRILILKNDWSSPWEEISLFKTKQTNKQTEKQTKHPKQQPTTLFKFSLHGDQGTQTPSERCWRFYSKFRRILTQ